MQTVRASKASVDFLDFLRILLKSRAERAQHALRGNAARRRPPLTSPTPRHQARERASCGDFALTLIRAPFPVPLT